MDGTMNNVGTTVSQLLDNLCDQVANQYDGKTVYGTVDNGTMLDNGGDTPPQLTMNDNTNNIPETNKDNMALNTILTVKSGPVTNKDGIQTISNGSLGSCALMADSGQNTVVQMNSNRQKVKLVSSDYEDSDNDDQLCCVQQDLSVDDSFEEVDVLSYVTNVVQEDFDYLKKLSIADNDLELFPTLTNQTTSDNSVSSSSSSSSDDSDSSSSSSDTSSDMSSSSDDQERKTEPVIKEDELEMKPVIKEDASPRNKMLSMGLPPPVLLEIEPDENLLTKPLGEVEVFHTCAPIVVIKSLPDVEPIDIESVLFLEDHTVLGQVMELIGQVDCPYYCVGFDNDETMKNKKLSLGQKVYYAPNNEQFTKYVFVKNIKSKQASDVIDEDSENECEAFSDGEAEKATTASNMEKRNVKRKNKSNNNNQSVVQGSQRNQPYQTRMQHFHHNRGVRPRQHHVTYNPRRQWRPLRQQYTRPPPYMHGDQNQQHYGPPPYHHPSMDNQRPPYNMFQPPPYNHGGHRLPPMGNHDHPHNPNYHSPHNHQPPFYHHPPTIHHPSPPGNDHYQPPPQQ